MYGHSHSIGSYINKSSFCSTILWLCKLFIRFISLFSESNPEKKENRTRLEEYVTRLILTSTTFKFINYFYYYYKNGTQNMILSKELLSLVLFNIIITKSMQNI